MTETLVDVDPVFLDCQLAGDTPVLTHQGAALTGGELTIVLDSLSTTTVALTDFEHDGTRCRVNAFTIRDDGSLEPWARAAEGVTSPPIMAGAEESSLHVVVVPVAHAPAAAVSARILEAYEPDSWHILVRVRVPPKGTKPGG